MCWVVDSLGSFIVIAIANEIIAVAAATIIGAVLVVKITNILTITVAITAKRAAILIEVKFKFTFEVAIIAANAITTAASNASAIATRATAGDATMQRNLVRKLMRVCQENPCYAKMKVKFRQYYYYFRFD